MSDRDQISQLKKRMIKEQEVPKNKPSKIGPPIVAIAGGKGGVGKSHLAVNMALKMGLMGRKILLFDADFGLGNTDILLGITPVKTLAEAMREGKGLREIALKLKSGVTVIPSGSANFDVANANPLALEGVFYEMERFSHDFDLVIVDTGSGIGERVINSLLLADEIITIVTPEPTSLTDSYATIKLVSKRHRSKKFKIVVNMAENQRQATAIYQQLNTVSKKYLDLELDLLGWIPVDDKVIKATRKQVPFIRVFPGSQASLAVERLILKLNQGLFKKTQNNVQGFLKNFFNGNARPQVYSTIDNVR